MGTYDYKMSIIVPVYNVESYIHLCIESILKQTMDFSEFEVLLIDDGSSDSSLDICKKYSELYPMFKVITKENEGVSKTRNLGLKLARGKYVLYLDADDICSPNTFYNIWDFFERHYDSIDLVTYPLIKYNEKLEKIGTIHYRYKYLNKTGVYNLEETPFIAQTTMNICVKNESEKPYFDETMIVHEDQDYITRIVMKKGCIGFVKEAEYCYIQHTTSVMNRISAIELWFPTIAKYEEMFGRYEEVPQYLQALFFNDIKWKLVSDILYPSHLSDEDYALQMKRLQQLLEKVDVEIIMTYPDTDIFHRFYWLTMKKNSEVTVYCDNEQFSLVSANNILYKKNKMELIIHRILNFNGKPYILACVKSPIFSFGVEPKVYAFENTKIGQKVRQIDTFPSVSSYYKTRVKTNDFVSFYYECNADEVSEVIFKVEVDGFLYDTSYYLMPQCQIKSQGDLNDYANNGIKVQFNGKKFMFSKIDNCLYRESRKDLSDEICKQDKDMINFRKIALQSKMESKIWLYYDCKGVKKDNGYYQFIHDIQKNDGVERYYISDNSKEFQKEVFSDELMKNVVQFGSFYHKLLYVNADKIIVAFIEENNYCPFTAKELAMLKDILQYQIVYLQHGILHAHMPWKYSPEKINIDKIVVSSNYEVKNFVSTYGFNENMLIKSGMPRFDHFNLEEKTKKKILFAPTWRKYLIGDCKNNVWELKESDFLHSKYYLKLMSVLNSEKLIDVLEKNDIELDFKLHPIFQVYAHLFSSNSKNVKILEESQKDDEYKLFITDFSSYVFDFAYRKINIVYFLPDKDEFKVGLNGYRELDLPFEDAFGELITEEDDLVNIICQIISRNFIVEDKYRERMEEFYLPLEHCCEKIYCELVSE